MELSLEAYRNIVNYVGNRSDIATLCRVSKGFQYVAQRALYNTLYLRNVHSTISVCHTLSTSPRLAGLVDALTVSLSDKEQDNDSDSGDGSQSRAGLDEEENAPSITDFWEAIASALRITSRLRYLNIHINSSAASVAWILQGCAFRLRGFHCDLDWDLDLVTFLNTQTDLDDLYILDYQEDTPSTVSSSPSLRLLSTALPNLSTLECTFSEAAVAIVPGRPITHLKSCFSRTVIEEKHAEMSLLFSKIRHSSRRLRALDIADSSYTEPFSMELLRHVIRTKATVSELRYLGTLVLPIGGQEVTSNGLPGEPASVPHVSFPVRLVVLDVCLAVNLTAGLPECNFHLVNDRFRRVELGGTDAQSSAHREYNFPVSLGLGPDAALLDL
ncbi:hypothetical protein ONZ45_g1629 [Pleurotus djamor]|nr:hypothetical protein ONZ45_g1629 [Pleurotus djamor]